MLSNSTFIRSGAVWVLLIALVAIPGHQAAVPGLPLLEDFADTQLRNAALTRADWSIQEQALLLAPRSIRSGGFGPGVGGGDIWAGSTPQSIAVGDVDGDGDLDVVAGNVGDVNRVYLNNGSADPWSGVTGIAITADADDTYSVLLHDLDGDGDIDLIVGNDGQPNRYYLNNGTADPWNGAVSVDISNDTNATRSLGLADMDGDVDLDLVAGNFNEPNRLYLSNGTTNPWFGVAGSDVTPDADNTVSVALGDVDSDGSIDVVAGNELETNRVYLNNGTTNPFNGVSGADVTADMFFTSSVALGDTDGDGDLDVVVGNRGQADRVYLNNGTVDPFNGVSGANITADANDTRAVRLGDADGDGDLDMFSVTAASETNRLYLNNGSSDPWNGVSGSDITSDNGETLTSALADMDGDGDLDLVAGNRFYPSDGTLNPFTSGSNITADNGSTTSAALGDVDGDGDLDLVVGNFGQPNRLYLNNGTSDPWNGALGVSITLDSDSTQSVALGDVDGDGDLDLVVGNFIAANRLYLNNGTSDPWNGVSGIDVGGTGNNAASVELGDVDGDGDLDLVAGRSGTQANLLFLNNGTPDPWSGVSGVSISSDTQDTGEAVLGDVDGDGDLDLVAVNRLQANRLYLNNGTSDPWNGVSGMDITSDTDESYSVELGDVDGDGDLDLVVGNRSARNRLYLNNGTPDPWNGASGIDITTDTDDTYMIALGDVDRDGDLDLVTGNFGDPNRIYLGDGSSNPWNGISGTVITSDVDGTLTIAIGDTDGDGDLDVVTGNQNQFNRSYLNNGVSGPWSGLSGADITTDTNATGAIALGDVDGDGDIDLVTGNVNETNRVYLSNDTKDPWNGVAGVDITLDADNTESLVLGDVDSDGDLDLIAGNDLETNRLYLNNGTSDPWNGVSGADVTSDANASNALALGDVDGDGDLDLIAGNGGTETNRLYLNNGTSDPWNGVSGVDITADANDTRAAALGDVDGDGDLDLIVGNSGQTNRLYLNNGTSDPWNGVSGVDVSSDTGVTTSLALADVDKDGDLDLIAGNDAQTNRLYLNNGTSDPWNGVGGADITSDTGATSSLSLADVNRDGYPDLIAGNSGETSRLYLNNGTSDPWNGVVGVDITADAGATTSIALADLTSDGYPNLVVGNDGEANRIYGSSLFDTALGLVTSLRVDTETDPITDATLSPVETLPVNTGVDYWLSNDGSATWYRVLPGVPFGFPNPGTDLRWRAELRSLSPITSPRVDEVQITSQTIAPLLGNRVWEDLDGDGVQDAGEPGLSNVVVHLYDSTATLIDFAVTNANGNYLFGNLVFWDRYSLQFFPPPSYTLSPQDQGGDSQDSDPDPSTGRTRTFTLFGVDVSTRWDAGMVPAVVCEPPDEPVFLYEVGLTNDGNDYPILNFQDPNQPTQITGYNIRRNSDPSQPKTSWPLIASDVIDMDEGTPNKQWVDTSGDVSPSGIWYYLVTGYNNVCPPETAEGPFD